MRWFLPILLLIGWAAPAHAELDAYAALPRVWAADLSPDGRHLATGCAPRGQREICIYDLTGREPPRFIPAPEGGRITDFFWPSPYYLVYRVRSFQRVQYESEVERITVSRAVSYSMDSGESAVLLGDIANVSGLDEVSSVLLDHPDRVAMELTLIEDEGGPRGIRLESAAGYRSVVYEVDLDDGSLVETRLRSNAPTVQYVLDPRGRLLLDVRYALMSGIYTIYKADGRERTPIFRDTYPAGWPYIYGLIEGGRAVAIAFPEQGLFRMDLESGEFTRFEIDGLVVVGQEPILDRYSGEVVGFAYVDSLPRQDFIDPELAQLHHTLQDVLSEDSVTITAWTPDRNKMVIEAADPGQPANFYLLNLEDGELGLLDSAMQLPEGASVGRREYITYEASDGLEIPAYLTVPPGYEDGAGELPLVVMPHGGPQLRETAQFDWWSAYYASLGYAVLQPDYRGSAGYGQAFTEAGYGEFGGRMIDDIIDGVRFLESEGIARPGGYCAVGASYGGYAALMAGLRDADNVACIISFGAVTHPFALMASRDDFPDLVRFWEQYIGSRYTDPADQRAITPARRAREFRMPVLMMHGDEDTTVPYGQFRLMRQAVGLRTRIEFETLRGEDHFLGSQDVRRRVLDASGEFLQRHLPVDPDRGEDPRSWTRARISEDG